MKIILNTLLQVGSGSGWPKINGSSSLVFIKAEYFFVLDVPEVNLHILKKKISGMNTPFLIPRTPYVKFTFILLVGRFQNSIKIYDIEFYAYLPKI